MDDVLLVLHHLGCSPLSLTCVPLIQQGCWSSASEGVRHVQELNVSAAEASDNCQDFMDGLFMSHTNNKAAFLSGRGFWHHYTFVYNELPV